MMEADFSMCSPASVRSIRRSLGLPVIDDPEQLADLERQEAERRERGWRLMGEVNR